MGTGPPLQLTCRAGFPRLIQFPGRALIDTHSLKEQIRQRIDLVGLISEHVVLKRAGKDFVGLCPFHQEKSPSFSVSAAKGIFKCFGCGAGGDVFSFIQRRENVEFPEALRLLADRAGLDSSTAPRRSSGPSRVDLAKINAWAATEFHKLLKEPGTGDVARQYLAGRQINDEMISRFSLGFSGADEGRLRAAAKRAGFDESALRAAGLMQIGASGDAYAVFRSRLMFPIRDSMNRVIGFGGRTLIDEKAKYLNTAQNALFDKGQNLYGVDLARQGMTRTRVAIVVEGYTDCIAAHQFGFDHTVATLGTALTEDQVNLLRRWADKIVLVFDSDDAGANAADRAIGVALKHNLSVCIARVPEGKDPCDFLMGRGAGPFEETLNLAVDALGFKWQRTCERFASQEQGGGRRQAVGEFISLVAQSVRFGAVDAITRGLMVNQISQLLAIPAGEVHNLLSDAARKQARTPDASPASTVATTASRVDTLDAEQAAMTTLLAVLLNEPGLYSEAIEVFKPERLADEQVRRIANQVESLCREVGEFRLAELLDALLHPEDATRVADLVYHGGRFGDLAETLAGCRVRLEEIMTRRQLRQSAERLLGGVSESPDAAVAPRDGATLTGFGGSSVSAAWSRYCKR